MSEQEPPNLALLWVVLGLLGAYLLLTQAGDWAPVIIVYGAVTVVVLLTVFLALSYTLWLYRNWRAPRRDVKAVVERKWTREYDYDVPQRRPSILAPILNQFFSPTATIYEQWVFWVSFRVDGRELEFAVPESTYVSLTEGSVGVLTFKGEQFLDFRPLTNGQSGAAR